VTDPNSDGLDVGEFKFFVNHPSVETYFFVSIDSEENKVGDGKITRAELQKLGMSGGPEVPEEMDLGEFRRHVHQETVSKELYTKLDTNGDGKISYEEFKNTFAAIE